jgi:hypothetical protein
VNTLEEPGAGVPHAGILCGGCRVTGISTVTIKSRARLPRPAAEKIYFEVFNVDYSRQYGSRINRRCLFFLFQLSEGGNSMKFSSNLAKNNAYQKSRNYFWNNWYSNYYCFMVNSYFSYERIYVHSDSDSSSNCRINILCYKESMASVYIFYYDKVSLISQIHN